MLFSEAVAQICNDSICLEHTTARYKCGSKKRKEKKNNRNVVKYDETTNGGGKKKKRNCTQNSNEKVSHETEKAQEMDHNIFKK